MSSVSQVSSGAVVNNAELSAAQRILEKSGFWQELSGAAGAADLVSTL
ncbi:MAG: hypothetical protein LC749_13925 [Actinobacteria bacterium]|nr:hypothetical protein [Actinomycetota bacterium]